MPLLVWILPPLALAAIAWMFRRPLLRAAGRLLVVHDDPGDCEAIVLLNGNLGTRPYLAAEIYRRRPVPVLLARLADTEEVRLGVIPNISEATAKLLERLGVASGDIRMLDAEGWVAGTWHEALLHRDYLREQGCTRIVVVTDAFHTRRARWVFRQLAGDELTVSCAATRFTRDVANAWWASEYGLIQFVVECLKFAHYRRARRTFPLSPRELSPAAQTRRMIRGG